LWNEKAGRLDRINEDLLEDLLIKVEDSVREQFFQYQREDSVLRMSRMGKPAVELAMLHLENLAVCEGAQETSRIAGQWVFNLGDYFEALLIFLMKHYGVYVIQEQREVSYKGVKGHIDCIVKEGNKRILIEIKTMSGYYFNSFVKYPDDNRGYITQANLYYESLRNKLTDVWWLCLNKQNNELRIIECVPDFRYVERVEGIIEVLPKIRKFEDIKKHFDIPPLERDGHRKRVPQCMQYSPYVDLFYVFKNGKPYCERW
jgi:hypothetical protein